MRRPGQKANPGLGVSVKLDNMRAAAALAKRQTQQLNEFLRKRCNLWTQAATRWLSQQVGHLRRGAGGGGGRTGVRWAGEVSSKINLTAAVIVVPKDGSRYNVLCRFYRRRTPSRKPKIANSVPYREWAADGHLVLMEGHDAGPGSIQDNVLLWVRELGLDVPEIAFNSWNAASAQAV